jgi:phage gp36-like protein
MAIYTTIEDLKKRLDAEVLAGLADDENTPPSLSDPDTVEVINQAIGDGASLIDSYLLGHVELASPQVQASLERINATLALYFLYRRRYVDDALNPLAAAREAVSAHLAAVARGEEHLGDGDDGSPSMEVYSTTEDSERVLDDAKLGRF